MTYCHALQQIANHCNEPEPAECPECFSSMTLEGNFLICDECNHTIDVETELGDDYE